MDNLDDFLNSIGLPSSETSSEEPQVRVIVPDPEPTTLSDEDYDNILSDIGFEGPPDADAEEITEEEESEEEVHTNLDVEAAIADDVDWDDFHIQAVPRPHNLSTRDLDEEEDADWQEAIDSGRVVPHYNYVGDGELSQLRDFRMDPNTGEVQVMTGVGVVTIGATVQETDMATVESPEPANEQEETREPLIPVNSPTLLMDDTTSRFSGAEWYNEIQRQRVIIAGCGGIGSNVCLQVARMAPASMVLYDDDVVETVNMAGQLYCTNDVGKSKVDAMVDMITSYTSMRNIYALKQKTL